MKKVEKMSWKRFDEACRELAVKVNAGYYTNFKTIYGVPRGGLVVAVRLSNLLNIPMVTESRLITNKTLIVDDISDSGRTLKSILDYLKWARLYGILFNRPLVATIHYREGSLIRPDFWVLKKGDCWIRYPWESK
jgi:hypoxanthine phosphoribosyltransferase